MGSDDAGDIDHDTPTSTAERLSKLTAGTTLHISDLSDTLGGYSAALVDDQSRLLWIDIPIRRDGMLTLSVGQLVSVRFDRPGDAVYLFDTVVAETRDDDRSPYGLARPVTIDRRKHRADVRLALVLEATFRTAGNESADPHPAKVVDLSAGGIGLITDSELQIDDALEVEVDLPGPDRVVPVSATVSIRSTSLYGRTPSGAVLHQYGLEFVDVNESMRDQVLAAVIWNLTQNPAVL